jgi:gluconolactonase
VRPDGTTLDFLETGGVPLNCIFHEGDLIITDFGEVTEVTAAAPMDGRLWRVSVGVEGMPLFRGSIVAG